jgi:hypothetical protein
LQATLQTKPPLAGRRSPRGIRRHPLGQTWRTMAKRSSARWISLQRTASRHVLVIIAYYVASPYCCYEMEQAIKYSIKPSR